MQSLFVPLWPAIGWGISSSGIRELLRVCRKRGQVLIYPIKTLGFDRYPELTEIMSELSSNGVEVCVRSSDLPFIPGSSELLSLVKG
ncbi:hypothetical protein D3C78_1189290 [compost metagenome]